MLSVCNISVYWVTFKVLYSRYDSLHKLRYAKIAIFSHLIFILDIYSIRVVGGNDIGILGILFPLSWVFLGIGQGSMWSPMSPVHSGIKENPGVLCGPLCDINMDPHVAASAKLLGCVVPALSMVLRREQGPFTCLHAMLEH